MSNRFLSFLVGLFVAVGCGAVAEEEPSTEQDVSIVSDAATAMDAPSAKDTSSTEQDATAQDGSEDVKETCADDDSSCDGVDDDCDGQTDEDAASGDCDDGNPCTTNGCVDSTCQTANKDGSCDDGNACTEGDSCAGGLCAGTAKDCSDDNACTKDQCNPSTGDCGYAIDDGAGCDDGDPCTDSDVCKGANCSGGVAKLCPAGAVCTIGVCDSSTGACSTATAPDGQACDDGDPCSVDDGCAAGKCQVGGPKPCPADKPCEVSSCDPSTGQCVSASVANGKACDDGNPCTQSEACIAGLCKGTPIACDDLNPCTTDACDIAVGCTATDNTNPCDDKDPCTVNDICAAGTCLPGSAKSCDDNNPCTTDACDQVLGTCKQTPGAGGPCNDGDYCTLQDKCNEKGGCGAGKAKNCDDGKPCTIDWCDPANGKCTSKQAGQGVGCDDGSFCTIGDKCDALGFCQPGQKVSCVDNNPCTVDTCVAQTGQCAFQSFPDGAMCDDGDACSSKDSCKTGTCAGIATNCDDANACTTDFCEQKTGKCKNSPTTAACDDSNACSLGEDCSSGACKAPVSGSSRPGFGTGNAGFTDGDVSKARVSTPGGLDHASDGRVFLADRNNHRIRLFKLDATGGQLTTFAGSGSAAWLDGPAKSARFNYPAAVAWHEGTQTLYVADRNNHRIRKIKAAKVTTLAGSSLGSVDGSATKAKFNYPEGIDVTVGNVVYVSDTNNHKIRRITADGQVVTFAGTGTGGFADGTSKVARFNYPRGLIILADGSLIVADASNHRVRKVNSAGLVTTLAGTGSASFLNGAVKTARFSSPFDVATGPAGAIFVADNGNRRIRKIFAGQVTTYSGSGSSGSVNGAPAASTFTSPQRISTDVAGQVWVTDVGAHRIRILGIDAASCDDANPCTKDSCSAKTGCKFSALKKGSKCSDGSLCTSGDACSETGQCLGKTKVCADNNPCTIDSCDSMTGKCAYTATEDLCDDGDQCTVGENCSSGTCAVPESVNTWVGSGSAGYTNGKATTGRVNYPRGLAKSKAGIIYLADRNNHRIRKISKDGSISLLAGSGLSGNTNGNTTSARFYYPSDVAVSVDDSTIYVADRYNHRIRKISGNNVTTLAGSTTGFTNGQGTAAKFYYPEGIATDPTNDTLVIADSYNNRIRRVTAAGVVTTIAGSGSASYKEGKGTGANFYRPHGVAVSPSGIIYVADTYNHRIRQIKPDGTTELLVGSTSGFANGNGFLARVNYPMDLSIRSDGKVLVADRSNHRIRMLDPVTKSLTTLSGSSAGFVEGASNKARFNNPHSVLALPKAADGTWPYLVSDYNNHRIRRSGKGLPKNCDDGNVCTTDSCDSKMGCQYKPVVNCCDPVKTFLKLDSVADGSGWTFATCKFGSSYTTPSGCTTYTPSSATKGWQIWNAAAYTKSKPGALYYGNIATQNFGWGASAGYALSQKIPVPAGSAKLEFSIYNNTESGTSYDRTYVFLFVDGVKKGGAIYTKSSANTWQTKTVDVSAHSGKQVQLQFYFNTVDSISNTGKGVFVDNIKLIGTCPKK